MKRYIKNLLLIAAAMLTTACGMDKLQTPDDKEQTEVGYLRIGQISTNADTETGELNGGQNPSTSRAETTPTAAPDTYYLEIVNVASTATVWSGTIAELKAKTDAQVGVEPGNYVVYAYQDAAKAPAAGAAENKPYYAGKSQTVSVVKKQSTTFSVTCKLANILTTVELSADLKAMFKTDAGTNPMLQTDVKVGTSSLMNNYVFSYTSTHDAPKIYFADVAGPDAQAGNTLTFTLTGLYYTGDPVHVLDPDAAANIDPALWKEVKMEKSLTGVKAAQWRKISIDIDHNTTGDVQFVIDIESFTYDEEIVVDLMTLYANADELFGEEESIPDEDEQNPDAPDVTIDGQSDLNFAINSLIYDAELNKWMANLIVNVTPKEGSTVEQVYAVFESDNASLLTNMATKGFAEGRVALFPTNAATAYANVKADGTKISVLDSGMDALYRYNGTHTVKVFTIDSEKRMKSTEIVITVSSSGVAANGPTAVWMIDGVDVLDQKHTLDATTVNTLKCVINITSVTGLTRFEVDIESDVLDDEALGDVGLGSHIDMVSPGSMLTNLKLLGLMPNGMDSVGGATSVDFTITDFFSALFSLYQGKAGDCVFTLTLADSTGTTEKSLQLYVNNLGN